MAIRFATSSTQRVVFDTTVSPRAYQTQEFTYFSVFKPTTAWPGALPIIMQQLVGVSSGRLFWVAFGSTELEVGRTGGNAKATENGAPPTDEWSINFGRFSLTDGARIMRGTAHRPVKEVRYSILDLGSGSAGTNQIALSVGNAANAPDPFTGLDADMQWCGIIARAISKSEMEDIRKMWAHNYRGILPIQGLAFFANMDRRDSGGLIIDRVGMATGTITNATYPGTRAPNTAPWSRLQSSYFKAGGGTAARVKDFVRTGGARVMPWARA